jgi:hypothetical protein
MTDGSVIGRNNGYIKDDNILLGKEIAKFSGEDGKKKALEVATSLEGSEIIYQKDNEWHVAEVAKEGVVWGTNPVSKKDELIFESKSLEKNGISNYSLSFVEDSENKDDRLKAAQNPSTSKEVLSVLAEKGDLNIKIAVIENPSTSKEIINKITESTINGLKSLTLTKPNLDDLKYLRADPLFIVTDRLVSNKLIPTEKLNDLRDITKILLNYVDLQMDQNKELMLKPFGFNNARDNAPILDENQFSILELRGKILNYK